MKMTTFQILTLWIFLLVGITQGKHASRTRASGIGRVGNPVFSIDPFALTSLNSMASSSSSSSSASSSGGSARSLSSASTVARRPNSLASQVISSARRRGLPVITRVQGRPVLIVNPGGSVNPRSQFVSRPRRPMIRRIEQRPQSSQNNVLLELLGIAPSSVGSRRIIGLSHQPPGVSYLGNHQRLSRYPEQILLQQTLPIISNPLVRSQPSISQTGLGSILGGKRVSPVIRTVASRQPDTNAIPGLNGLRIGGVTPTGELIIKGVGGTITIGPELLNGISRANSFPIFTEFEEIEAEAGAKGAGANRNSLKLTEPGRGSIVLAKAPGASASSSAGSGTSGAGSVVQVLSGGTGGVIASSSASSSASSASSQASSSSSSSSASASVSSAAAGPVAEPAIAIGNGITVESGGKSGRVITLGDNGAKKQVITMGGSNGQVKVANGGAGIQVPGNATFIVAG